MKNKINWYVFVLFLINIFWPFYDTEHNQVTWLTWACCFVAGGLFATFINSFFKYLGIEE